jgi:magnesium transporter
VRKKNFKIRKKGLPAGTLIYTGDVIVDSPFVTVCQFDEQHFEQKNNCTIHDFSEENHRTNWIDVRGLSDVPLIARLGETFKISSLVLEDVLDTQQRPKFEEYENGLLFILTHLDFDPKTITTQTEQISIYWGNNFVLSFQEDPSDTFESIRTRLQDPKTRIRRKKADYLANALLDFVVDNYYLTIDAIESEIETIEENLFHVPDSPKIRAQVYQIKRVAFQFRRKLLPLRDGTFRFLKTESQFVDDSNRDFFRDVLDHITQIIDTLDQQIETINGFQELSMAESGNRLNNVMRLLTVISTIFIPLSFVAGIYGMNFDNMPELHHPHGYFYVLIFMFCAAIAMLWYFRRKRWI